MNTLIEQAKKAVENPTRENIAAAANRANLLCDDMMDAAEHLGTIPGNEALLEAVNSVDVGEIHRLVDNLACGEEI